jgi:hypothetical protein
MVSVHGIDPRIKELLKTRLTRVEQLVTLLLLHRHADRWWSAEEAAAHLKLPWHVVAIQLESLALAKLVDVRPDPDIRYHMAGTYESDETRQAIGLLAEAFARDPEPIVRLLAG